MAAAFKCDYCGILKEGSPYDTYQRGPGDYTSNLFSITKPPSKMAYEVWVRLCIAAPRTKTSMCTTCFNKIALETLEEAVLIARNKVGVVASQSP